MTYDELQALRAKCSPAVWDGERGRAVWHVTTPADEAYAAACVNVVSEQLDARRNLAREVLAVWPACADGHAADRYYTPDNELHREPNGAWSTALALLEREAGK